MITLPTQAAFQAYRDAHPGAGVWETIATLMGESLGVGEPFDAGLASDLLVLDVANGAFQELTLDEAHELGVPANGSKGAKLELWVTASGADRDLTFNTGIVQQDGTTFDGTCTVLEDKTRILYFRYKVAWMLVALSGNF